MKSFNFQLEEGIMQLYPSIVGESVGEGLCGKVLLGDNKLNLEYYLGSGKKVPLKVNIMILEFVVTFMAYRVHSNIYKIISSSNSIYILMGKRKRKGFSFLKQYKINDTWGIRCYNRKWDNAMCIEVFMFTSTLGGSCR